MNKNLTLFFLTLLPFLAMSQEIKKESHSKFYGDVFLNANHNFEESQSSFRLNRLHFGYKHSFNDALYFNGMIESAREDYNPTNDYNEITNLFEFCLGFKLNKVEGKFGLIGTEFNQQQENLWKHRYVDKVFADKYGFAPTNDYGVLVIYKPLDIFNIDLAITNGEGHKEYQIDSAFRYALGATLKPSNGIVARAYGDMLFYDSLQQTNIIGILGYQTEKISIGAEYNHQLNSANINDFERSGLSGYCSYNITEEHQVFCRYDNITSNKPEGFASNWNIDNDGQLIIAGFQHKPHEKIKFALDYRAWITEANNESQSYIFFDIELAF